VGYSIFAPITHKMSFYVLRADLFLSLRQNILANGLARQKRRFGVWVEALRACLALLVAVRKPPTILFLLRARLLPVLFNPVFENF
jgi:hypothetical protein